MNAWLVPLVDLNPFHWAGDKIKESLADAFTAMMMAIWSAGLWLLDLVFGVIDRFTTPNVANPGLGNLYGVTLWISFLMALVIGLGQVGLAAIRRDGRSLGSLAIGIAQYGAVVAGWVGVCAGLIVGSTGLTKGLLHTLLGVDGFSGYSASAGMTNQVTGTVQAAVLGLCALFLLIPASFGYLLIMLVREAGLMILTATMPIAAAGALGDSTKAWMWKSVRWFVAACLTAPLLALVVGIGVQISQAAFPGGAAHHDLDLSSSDSVQQLVGDSTSNVGMAVVGCVIFLVACFCPMALFRLLAFVDPGTASGASFRSTMAANGGVSGLLAGRRSAQEAGSGAATQAASDGRAASEGSADAETANRFQSRAARAFGGVGKVAGKGMDLVGGVAATGASMSVDVMGQSGVGHQGYYDTTPPPRRSRSAARTRVGHGWDPAQGAANDPAHIGGSGGATAEAAEVAEDGAFLA
jgi:type IV secretion system protein TrbL